MLVVVAPPANSCKTSISRWLNMADQIRVLVVDDHALFRRGLVGLLGEQPDFCIVGEASNGVTAVKLCQQERPHVVLMDVHMPEMDGRTATQMIRELPGDISKIPIIALTADAMVGDREKYLAAGMDDYVSKPFDPQHLFSTIRRCVLKASISAEPAPSAESFKDGGAQADSGLDPSIVEPLRVGKPDLWKRLIGIYLENTPDSLETLERALTNDDCPFVQNTAHALKSSSANMGAAKLSDLCRQLETAAREANLDTGRALFAEIRSEFNIVSAALARDVDSDAMTKRSTV